MDRKTYFVDVILPLAIPNMLTYRVPFEMNEYIQIGQRAVVQLGKSKLHTAIIANIHENPPAKYEAKYIESIIDETPIVNAIQLKLWNWMANYYMCTLGEVMNAALPSSLKLASETKIVINDHWEGDTAALNDKEFLIVEALQIQEVLTLKEIAEILQQKTVQNIIKGLIEKKIVITEEELKQLFKPKQVEMVQLAPNYVDNEEELQEIFSKLEKRAYKQLQVLMTYIHLCGKDYSPIKKNLLAKESGTSTSVINALIKREVLISSIIEVGRIETLNKPIEKFKILSEDQEIAYQSILNNWKEKDVVLLHGVTGSGKTEIYVKLIQEAFDRGEQVLYLLPEIALTTQLINRLTKYFGKLIGVYHSKFNQNERVEVWNKVLKNQQDEYRLIIGARSSLFLPFSNLGLIIVDEEHENSFKQYNPAPRYNGRDMALILGHYHRAKTLFGSATPAIETYWNSEQGRYGMVKLNARYGNVQMPEIQCADIAKETKQKTMNGIFTSALMEEMKLALKNKEQVILFQNRRGYSPFLQCRVCGHVPNCNKCDVSLTYHKRAHQLKCHYCGYASNPPQTCDACGSSDVKQVGFGTEKIEEELEIFFPEAVIKRMDLDTTRSKNAYQKIIYEFEERNIDILVGTQMVTKGLDFDNVSLVGVISADQMINFPDFRSFERAFQLMTQVAGRAGRKKKRGKVIIQTVQPQHWVIQKVMSYDYEGFYQQEILERRNFLYPPFNRLIKLTLKHKNQNTLFNGAFELAKTLRNKLGSRVLGPETPYVSKINNQYLQNILIKIEREASPSKTKLIIKNHIENLFIHANYKSIRVVIDVDPV